MWLYGIILYLSIGFIIVHFTRAKDVVDKSVGDTDLEPVPLWKSTLFKMIVYGVAILLWPVFIKSWFEKPKSVWDKLNENPIFQKERKLNDTMQDLCADGVDTDEFPNGYGEFGLTQTNPIPCNTVHGSIAYLSRLVTEDGTKANHNRIGSLDSEVTSYPVDAYKITGKDGEKISTIYISPYQKRNSCKPPSGLRLI